LNIFPDARRFDALPLGLHRETRYCCFAGDRISGESMQLYFIAAIAAVSCLALAAVSFRRPDRVFARSAAAAVLAVILPWVVAVAVGPFLGEGAGMGVAFILYAFSAAILLAAASAALGAAARRAWAAMRD
jgi:hypothetical protein